ncbi:MAG: DJ-1/PfpI family protein [Sphaerochaetaceae bacterium]|nr:DJ-1/PfpI family protein [Sphaerochaetaceae bacterium]
MQTADRKVLVILAEGFEEIEALAPVDILRRSGASVTVAGLGSKQICGSHGISVSCDVKLSDVLSNNYDAVVLPGGLPGAQNLHDSNDVASILKATNSNNNLVCAICASPAYVLAPLGLLEGRKATCYPGVGKIKAPEINFENERVVVDGNLITAQGPGTAMEFGFAIVKGLLGQEISEKLKKEMICKGVDNV